jgi:Holliday junction DNA helicase RuvA
MIGKIKGILTDIEGNIGLIETPSGVFYEVFLTSTVLSAHLPPAPIEIRTYLHVREDIMQLYGFSSSAEYKIFKMLLDVPGVGPKSAFTVISYSKTDELISAIKRNDEKYFTRIPGLGKKTALKIILELANKFDAEFTFKETIVSEVDKTVMDALSSLGFRTADIQKAFDEIPRDLGVEEKIREGIKLLTHNK